jgi:small subunit ribosomal protein S20
MPNIQSAAKRMRSSRKRMLLNQEELGKLKTLSKKFQVALTAQDAAKAKEQGQELIREYDKAASRGIIPKGRADRKKSRIALAIQKVSAKK